MRRLAVCGVALILLTTGARALAQSGPAAGAVVKGVQFLRTQTGKMNVGEAGLAALALSKAEVPANDPAIQQCLAKILPQFTDKGYIPEKRGGHEVYEAAVVCMALSSIDAEKYYREIEALAKFLLAIQKSNGAWDYFQPNRTAGDSSMTQYALLGLWEAESIGVDVPVRVWDVAAQWYLSKQRSNGGWNYHPDEAQWPETVSMTAAGSGSLLLCRSMLDRYRKGPEVLNPLLTPLIAEGDPNLSYKIVSSTGSMNAAARRGIEWLERNYQPAETDLIGLTAYYALYGVERVAALAPPEMVGSWDWYDRGVRWALGQQKSDGSWDSRQYGPIVNTSWAILFAVKSTEKAKRKIEIRRLGAGTLLGGRGLPTDLNNMTIAQGRVVVRPMNGAVESMIAVLEDPSATNADAALAGLVARYQAVGPDALRPFKDRFRKLLTDRDPGVRRVSCWALGRSGDLDVAPNLIRALLDPDDAVVVEARTGLQVLSRKIDSLGPPRNATPEQKLEAARRWRDWYESVRPPDLDPLDDPVLNKPIASPSAPPPGPPRPSARRPPDERRPADPGTRGA